MGVYACLLISILLLIFQTVWISAIPNNASSLEYGVSNHSINSLSVQQHHQVLVSPRGGGGGVNRTVADWIVLRARGGRSGGVGGSNINHRPGKANQKNAASNLLKSTYFSANSAGLIPFLLVLIFLMSF